MFNNQKTIKALALALLASFAVGTAGTAFAGKWQQHHPRRTQVNSRLNNQNRRIHAEVKKGENRSSRRPACTTKTAKFAMKNAPWLRRTARTSPTRNSARSTSRKTR